MGILKCGNVDFNDKRQVQSLNDTIQRILDDPLNYHRVVHRRGYYFCVPDNSLPQAVGWYIILNGTLPVYVGKADDLNKRLNTEDGSRDQFANPKRASDAVRNFIKKYTELDLLRNLRVCVVPEERLGLHSLTDLDRINIEKHLDIWRGSFRYK
jgi:hypothetical protein